MRKPTIPAHTNATVFINARLIDPASGRDEPGGLLVKDGVIADLGPHLRRNAPEGATVVDCRAEVFMASLYAWPCSHNGQRYTSMPNVATPVSKC